MTEASSVHRADVGRLAETGKLTSSQYLGALGLFRGAKQWDNWVVKALFALGVGHILAGIICFFAFNWADLSDGMKFGVVKGALVASILLWLGLRLNTAVAQAFGIAATVLTGVLLAVFGQVYQTPAAIYTPFILWAFLTFPFALASKSVPHWAVWLAIAVTAALTYIKEGLVPASGQVTADWATMGLVVILMGLSALYHHLSRTKMLWARTSWFRISVLLAAIFLAVALFFKLFWDLENTLVWISAYVLVGGALIVIYRFWPTLPALSLTAFAFIIMTAQFGLKFIAELVPGGADDIGQIFLVFIWMALTTFVLARTFKYFRDRFGHADPKTAEEETFAVKELEVTQADIVAVTGLDSQGIESVFSQQSETNTPWYMDVLIGMSGVLTAIFAVFFLAVLLGVLISNADMLLFIVLGFVTWGGALFARLRSKSEFTRHFFNTLVLAGGGLFLGAIGIEVEGNGVFILVSIAAFAFTLWRVNDRIIGFLMGASFACILLYALTHFDVPLPFVWLCPVLMGLAVIGLAKPIGERVYVAAGSACLVALPFWGAILDNPDIFGNAAMPTTWFGVIASVMCTGGAVYALNRMGPSDTAFKPSFVIFVPLLLACAMMPVGAAAALLIVLTGYILGSRALAVIGVAAQIFFLQVFYYDLQISLFNKSIMLTISGILLVLIWAYIRKAEGAHV